ncbi:coiled-coil domain-containing protein 142 isoform X2 [Perognathus longimembris pacificus]|uniref:coiled-coil domain-containing protein 142 isoform X2 n=1 Tax=Perognathus longimembris pacificus TaxID=214514 RepID=UPI0020197E89|nr:coiled-coil domain-containing protein 142 isoform X2 [Perognathus longimembris pacificus]
MAQVSRSGGLLPPLANVPSLSARPGGAREQQWEGRRTGALRPEVRGWRRLPVAGSAPLPEPRIGGVPGGQPWWARADADEDHGEETAERRGEPAAGGPVPPALQRLRAVLLRLHREREQLLQARDCARHLQAVVRLLGTLSPHAPARAPGPLPPLCRDLQLYPFRGTIPRVCLGDTVEPLLVARPLGLAVQRLDAVIEMQLRVLGRAPACLGWTSQLAELELALPVYSKLLENVMSHLPGAARPFPQTRVFCLLTRERGCQVASLLEEALRGSGWQKRLRRWCHEEQELLPGLLSLIGNLSVLDSSGPGLGEKGVLWSQYWTLLWATCAQSLDLTLGPWRDPKAVAQQLSQALGQAYLPQECEKELASMCHRLLHQSLIWTWDQGFCKALGSTLRDQSNPVSASGTAELLQKLFPPLLDGLQELRSGLILHQSPGPLQCLAAALVGPAPIALGLCTLQTTLVWFLGRAQHHLTTWFPGSFLLLIQKDLPPLLHEVETLSNLTSEESIALEVEQQLGLEIQKLTAQMKLLPEESLTIFFQECHKRATQGFKLHMPRGRYWRLHLCPELPSAPSEYAGMVVRSVLEPILQGLQGLPPQAQAPALSHALTAILGAWLDYILTHGIRFSLQGALQLRQDFGVVRELLEEEQWGLSLELRQTLLMLGIFQQLDGALLCLLQQPLPKNRVHRRPSCCCVCHEVQTTELPHSSLNSLESLEPPLRLGAPTAHTTQLLSNLRGRGPSPEVYLVGNQQAWLALRQHQHPRWHLPFLSCLGTSVES